MTQQEIQVMEAGPEMDALVAEHVMGWTREGVSRDGKTDYFEHEDGFVIRIHSAWYPSECADHAWEVVEKLKELNRSPVLSSRANGWYVSTRNEGVIQHRCQESGALLNAKEIGLVTAEGPTMPVAVCRAALLWAVSRKEQGK